ncbi:MAG: ATP-dependent RNA helicase RhlB [Acidiferrobacterales bacterium]|nr:ATP-dependent RNA helicase RhlB [Acidiferrobacterales bacterium]
MTDTHLSDIRFQDLDIHPTVKQGIEASGFEFCTPIQASSLPIALQGKDISGQAQTGTGKTAAFLIACMHKLLTSTPKENSQKNPIRALVLAPTRELAIQIAEDGKALAEPTGLKLGLAYGGTDYDKQRKVIQEGVDILIGTPGRVIDYFKQKVFSLESLEVIILDEADRMFDLGFIADIRFLFRRMPEPQDRLNMLFSATLSHRVAELAYEHMSEPEVVKIDAEAITADRVSELAYMPSNEEKIPLLLGLIEKTNKERTVVFINTKHQAEKIQAWLKANDFEVALLSGDVPQKKRESLLKKFKEGKCNILVATDVAARGLHIPSVNYVINYDLPNDAEDYVHRIGRTARAGQSGTAISLICETYAMNIIDIEEYIKHPIAVEKEVSELLYKDPNKPDLPKSRSKTTSKKRAKRTSKKDSTKSYTKDKNTKSRSNVKQSDKTSKPRQESLASKESQKVSDFEKLPTEPSDSEAQTRSFRRSFKGREVPAIG